jgi:hypothetical protein
MITIFENFDTDYTLIDLHKLDMPLIYSVFNRQGDKEYRWRFSAKQRITNLFLNKVVTIRYEDENLTDFVEKINAYNNVDIPILKMKFTISETWRTINTSMPIKIWNDDSETAKQVRLEIEAKKYNL